MDILSTNDGVQNFLFLHLGDGRLDLLQTKGHLEKNTAHRARDKRRKGSDPFV